MALVIAICGEAFDVCLQEISDDLQKNLRFLIENVERPDAIKVPQPQRTIVCQTNERKDMPIQRPTDNEQVNMFAKSRTSWSIVSPNVRSE